MASLGAYNSAIRVARLMRKIAASEIDRKRPEYRYAVVTGLNAAAHQARVQVVGDDSEITVNVGGNRPTTVGQKVRIAGRPGDRYIDDVPGGAAMVAGVAVLWTGAGSPPAGWVLAGSTQNTADYPDLATLYGASGATFVVPTLATVSGFSFIVRT